MLVRNTARALIIQNDKLLTIKKERPDVGIYYTLPGGAQERGETLEQTLRCECHEELGVDVQMSKFVCTREYVSRNHEYSYVMKEVHAIEFIFECTITSMTSDCVVQQADVGQIGVEWLDNTALQKYTFPRTTQDFFKEYFSDQMIECYTCKIFEG